MSVLLDVPGDAVSHEFGVEYIDVGEDHLDDGLLNGVKVDVMVHDGPHSFLGVAPVDDELVAFSDVVAVDPTSLGVAPGY